MVCVLCSTLALLRALESEAVKAEAGARITNLVMQNLEQMVALSAKVDDALRKINEKSCQVDGVVIEISTASQEQSSGLGQISTACFPRLTSR